VPTYTVHNRQAGTQQNLTTTYKTLVSLTAATATLRRAQIERVYAATDGAPNATDCQVVLDVSRQTAAGTGTSATPTSQDPADAASDTVALVNLTVEPTVTASTSVLGRVFNQRGSVEWCAWDRDDMLIIPATNLAGFAHRMLSPTYALPAFICVNFQDR
jgi:hypothetical protein